MHEKYAIYRKALQDNASMNANVFGQNQHEIAKKLQFFTWPVGATEMVTEERPKND